MKRVLSSTGNLVENSTQVLIECRKYYKELYNKTPHPQSQDEDLQWHFLKHLTPVMNIEMVNLFETHITKDELFQSLKNMKKDASPGQDGLTVTFYLQFWNLISDIFFKAMQHAQTMGLLLPSMRCGVICLIPKKAKDLTYVKNWRPITLLNVDYKLISKTLATRLASVLPQFIGVDQRGFVKGRFIGDNVFELYSLIAQADLEQENGILLQLDIEKAFNSISWNYLFEVLNNCSFPSYFIDWVQTLYFKKEVHIINNGHLSDPIYPSNGLAQGDGLSPLLFVLVVETLALNIRANECIVGFKAGNIHKKLGMLADDMILSLKANQVLFSQTLEMLMEFSKISNLHVNYHKSAVFPIGPHRVQPVLDVTPFSWSKADSCNYLGVETSFIQDSSTARIPPILEHLDSVFSLCNSRQHTLLGRALIVRTFVASCLNYSFALAYSPFPSTLNNFQAKINKYIWAYGRHGINASLLYKPFDAGGINLYSLHDHYVSSKLKAVNKLFCEDAVFWKVSLQLHFRIPLKIFTKLNVHKSHLRKFLFPKTGFPHFLEASFT